MGINELDTFCAFSRNHKCIKFTDYQVTRLELDEADTICHDNWTEIRCLRHYIDQLENALAKADIPVPCYDGFDPDDPYYTYDPFDDDRYNDDLDDDDEPADYSPDDYDGPFGPLYPFDDGSDDDDKD